MASYALQTWELHHLHELRRNFTQLAFVVEVVLLGLVPGTCLLRTMIKMAPSRSAPGI